MVAGKVPKPFFYSNTYFDRSILPQFNEWFYKDPIIGEQAIVIFMA